jgi:uncharacterized protein
MIDLKPSYLTLVQRIVADHAPECDVLVFGSRVQGTAKAYSDLDIAVRCEGKLTPKQLGALREAFEESTLPIRVDVVDFQAISPEFRKVIEGKCEPLARAETGIESPPGKSS